MSNKTRVTAKDVMTQNYVKMDGMKTIQDAIKVMKDNNTDVIIVNKRDQHDAYGILLLSDIAKQVLAKNRAPERINIYEVMSKPVMSLPAEMNIKYCARLFEQFGLSTAPIIENEEILGLVGYKELVLHDC